MPHALIASCHCGAVRLEVNAPPADLNECHCSICRRYAVRWAYYSPGHVRQTGATDFYAWGDRELEFHRCRTCGCVTHWKSVDASYDRMGLNARLFEPCDLTDVPVRQSAGPA